MELKFTQEIKDNWLKNLKSGDYVQGIHTLYNRDTHRYCCIGVLGACTAGLTNGFEGYSTKGPYEFLQAAIGESKMEELWKTNDWSYNPDKPDYSNVIPLIEALAVQAPGEELL